MSSAAPSVARTGSGIAPTVPLDDIQSGIFDGREIAHEAHLFVQVNDAARARGFLRAVANQVTAEADVAPDREQPPSRLSIGWTWAGLAALGVDPSVLSSFPDDFVQGMASRAPVLGDNGANAPQHWEVPYSQAIHAWIMVQASVVSVLDDRVAELSAQLAAADIAILGVERGDHFGPDVAPAQEHFGFNDNLSQPGIEGVGQPVRPGQGTLQPDGTWKPIPVGCFLLGYPNGYGDIESRPSSPEIRQNGTYMVFRKLEQDVPAFRAYVSESATLLGIDPELCAAKFVGRWRSGVPLELSPEVDDPSILKNPETCDAFGFGGDADGVIVPHFAHIRRANPRDSLSDSSMVDVTNHRIIRRSAPYGPYLSEGATADDGKARGLLFRAFNASLLDQFELIQSEWINSANEAHGLSTDRDPFIGTVEPMGPPARQLGSSFTVPLPDGSCPTRYNLPRFVTVKGGAYFFVPGIHALTVLAQDPPVPPTPSPAPDPGFLADYEAASKGPNLSPEQIAAQQVRVVLQHQGTLVALGEDLRRSDATKVFPTPIAVLLSTFPDIVEAFTRDDVFSVAAYGDRMGELIGPFILGMDQGPAYERESSVMRLVAPSSELDTLGSWIENFAAQTVEHAVSPGTPFDLVNAIANRIPLGFIAHYFGVPGPDDPTLMTWLRASALYIFEFWTTQFPAIKDAATATAVDFNSYLQWIIDDRLSLAASDPSRLPDDVLTRLLALLGPDPTKLPAGPLTLDLNGIRRNLAGFSIGCVVPPSGTIAFAMQYLLQAQNADALAMTRAAALADDDELLTQCMLEAARLGSASPPSLFRTVTSDYVMGRGTARATTIPKGSVVALYPSVAMTDPDFVEEPLTFRPGRPSWNYVMFGEGQHTCFGAAIGTLLLTYAGKALLKLPGLHEAGTLQVGVGVPGQFYPGRYLVAVAP
jgi:Dyp-type peroxidase family